MILKLLPLILGAWLAYAGLGNLALAALGRSIEATADETVIKAIKQVPDPEGGPPTFVLRAKVSYHFDAASGRAEGSDVWIWRSPYEVLAHDKGYGVPVVYLGLAPGINAVRQPRHLVVYGLLELLLGLALAVFEVKVLLRERRARLAALPAAAPAREAPADPWHDLGRPLDLERPRAEEPDDGIQPS